MAQVKPALTLDVNLGSSTHAGIGGSGTSTTPRSHHIAVNNKIQNHIHASTFAPQSDYQNNEFDQHDNSGFSSDDDAQDVYAAATSRLKAGSASAGAKATRDTAHSATQLRYHPSASDAAAADYDGEMDTYGDDAYAQEQHYQHHHIADGIHDEMDYDDDDDDDQDDAQHLDDDESDLSSSPSIPDENIDFDLVYALHNFVATVEGQATVHKGNSLTLLDDSNSYWWLVRVLRTQEVGYIPAENIETPFERLARLNKHRNVDLTSATDDDHIQVPERIFTSHLVKARNASGTAGVSHHSGKLSALSRRAQGAPAPLTKEQRRNKRGVVFGPSTYLEHSGDEYSDYDEDDPDEERLEYEEDPDAVYEDDQDDDDLDDHQQDAHQHRTDQLGFNKMEPDDGMDWDGHEAERVQQQHQDAMRAAAAAASAQSATDANAPHSEQQTHPYSQQYQANPAGPSHTQSQDQQQQLAQGPRQQQYATQHHQQQLNGDPRQSVNGRNSLSSQQQQQQQQQMAGPSYGSLQPSRVPGEHMRTTSAERSISSVSSLSASDAGARPTSTSMSRNSTSSSNGFLPSQIQRERASSDASASSTIIGADSSAASDKDKRKSNRTSKSNDSLDTSNDDKQAKKRSGVFSLFSRKDKKDRKSANFDERDSMVGISSEDSHNSYMRGRSSPAASSAPVNPVVQAANAGLQPGQSIGMGRAVQERDRATQEAYQRQFLSPQNASFDTSSIANSSASDDKRRMHQRPGSLIGPSGSTPMLSVLRVFAGEGVDSDSTFKTVLLNDSTRSMDLQRQALQRFGVNPDDTHKYVLTIKRLEGDERPLDDDEHPLRLFNTLTEILQQGQVTVPSVKRSSVGSISSISSNLSTHPAIARLGNDFSDDHAVKFYISRRDRLQGYVDLSGGRNMDESVAPSVNVSDLSTSQDVSNVTSLSLDGQDGARSSHSSVLTAEAGETVQSPTARFALRLIIYATDLPDGIVFDPQSNALIPSATLRERLSARPEGAAETGSQPRFREKILTFPRNTTVAEVVEEGLDRFGIAEGVVEGGDDVEDRPSRRKSKLHVKYGLAVQAADGERALATTSKVLEAYPSPPAFKLGIGNRRSVDGKRRSIDAAALLGASDDVAAHDPVFVLRQITHAHSGPKARQHLNTLGARASSPTDNALAASQDARQAHAKPATQASPRLGGARELAAQPSAAKQNMTPQEIIAAQRAAAAERNAAVLGAQRNAQQGVDVVLSNQARIRSSKLGPSNKFRYSYVPADGQERDISSIIEDVMRDAQPGTAGTASTDSGLAPPDARPPFGTKKSMQSDMTLEEYASARSSSGAESPLSLDQVNYEVRSPTAELEGVAPLSIGRQRKPAEVAAPVSDGDLLDNLLRGTPQNDGGMEERINAVLDRVQTPTPGKDTQAGGQALGARSVAATRAAHKKQTSIGSELSNSRETSSPLTVGTSSVATHATQATNTSGTMLTPLSTFVTNANGAAQARTVPVGVRSGSALGGSSMGGSRSNTPSAYPSVAALSFGADDASLSHLYTIVEAAARRDPRKARLMTHASMSSIASTTSPVLGSSALMGGVGAAADRATPGGGLGSRPGSKLSSSAASSRLAQLLEDDKDTLKPEPGGLFAPPMPFVEDTKLREAYSGINRQLGQIDDSLDELLADVIRIF